MVGREAGGPRWVASTRLRLHAALRVAERGLPLPLCLLSFHLCLCIPSSLKPPCHPALLEAGGPCSPQPPDHLGGSFPSVLVTLHPWLATVQHHCGLHSQHVSEPRGPANILVIPFI